MENRSETAGDTGRDGLVTKGHDRIFKGDWTVLYLHCGSGYMTVCTCQNTE